MSDTQQINRGPAGVPTAGGQSSEADLLLHPLMGAQGVRDEDARPYHERWRVVDADGNTLNEREVALTSVAVSLRFGQLVLRAPGMLRLDIPLDVIEDDPSVIHVMTIDGRECRMADEGALAAAWMSEVVGRPVRLLKRCD